MFLSSPVDEIDQAQASPVTTTFDPGARTMALGVTSERRPFSLPAEDPRAYGEGNGTWRALTPRTPPEPPVGTAPDRLADHLRTEGADPT